MKKENIRYSVFFDVANSGPDSNLGHAHADALEILLSSSEKEILIDSGVFTYEPGVERSECRSTKAHNTVEVDESNSAEIWSAFRVARRGHTTIREYSNKDNKVLISAVHDGYQKCLKNGVFHERTIVIQNSVITIADKLYGKGRHTFSSRFHIGASCNLKKVDEYTCQIDENVRMKFSLPFQIETYKAADLFGITKEIECIVVFGKMSKNANIITQIFLK